MSFEIRHALNDGQSIQVLFAKKNSTMLHDWEVVVSFEDGEPSVVVVQRDKSGGIKNSEELKIPSFVK